VCPIWQRDKKRDIGYLDDTSQAVSMLQVQEKQIEALKTEVAQLKKQLARRAH
jgi:hypothetical protein